MSAQLKVGITPERVAALQQAMSRAAAPFYKAAQDLADHFAKNQPKMPRFPTHPSTDSRRPEGR